jgi:hypothetical protein
MGAVVPDSRLRPFNPGAVPMRANTVRVRRPVRDYAMMAALAAILLSVAVLVGIACRYANRSDPGNDLAARMSAPIGKQLPSEL